MTKRTKWEGALARAERLAAEAIALTRSTAAPRSYAELSRRLDDAEVVLDLLAHADAFASLARGAEDPDHAEERAETAVALARQARDEAARRASMGEPLLHSA